MLQQVHDQYDSLPQWAKVAIGAGVAVVGVWACKSLFGGRRGLVKKDWKKDVVYLYQFPRSPVIANLSPFCLKVETWLRMAGIHHEIVEGTFYRSKEGTLPFVELNGKEYDDSSFIIRDLKGIFNKDPDSNLSAAEKGVSRAVDQMLDNSTVMSYAYCRYTECLDKIFTEAILGSSMTLQMKLLAPLKFLFPRQVKTKLWYHGIGKHSRDEIVQIGLDDLKALSGILGDKKFFFGDKPVTTDAVVFSHLSQMVYIPLGTPHEKFVKEKCLNLVDFCHRMRQLYFSDWEKLCKSR